MTTISRLGEDQTPPDRAPTFRIKSCPRCYGVLKWYRDEQTEAKCENCGLVTKWRRYHDGHMFPYVRQHLSFHHPAKTLVLILWALAQWIDHKFRLRRVLLYAFVKLLSWLP